MLTIIFRFWILNLYSFMEYRASFFLQSFGMFFSDLTYVVMWYFFFEKLGNFGGMSYTDMMYLYECVLLVYCIGNMFFSGWGNIARIITSGSLDIYLTFPRRPLLLILSSSGPQGLYGDILVALLLPFFLKGMTVVIFLKMSYLCAVAAVIFISFMVFFGSFAFFAGSSEKIQKATFELLVGPGHYPPKIFDGTFLKIIFLTIVPVYSVFFLPYFLTKATALEGIIFLHGSAFAFGLIGWVTFYTGLKRYESGNLLSVNS